jgi:hypothetical protein
MIKQLIDRLLEPIISKIKAVFAPFGKLITFFTSFWSSIQQLGGKIQHLINLVLTEVDEWRNFRENIAFRTKVVSLPAAIDHVQEFVQMIRAAWNSVLELVKQLKGKFETTGNPTQEAEEAIADIEASGFKTIIEKFPKLFKGLEKLLGFVAILLDALESIITAVDDLTTIVEALKAIREDVETGGPLFLKQTNRRRVERLADGGSIKIRVGNLHS